MRKSIFLAAFAALALSSCSSQMDEIFDKSAAERLDQFKTEYADVLTSDGGLWTMEYFSNEEEPGYLFVVKFKTDGSVDIAANHKWIDNKFQQKTSLWKMIADNGPVLSFSSYNPLFHIFSDPANITGAEAPKGENDEDINETGFGHEGDYEFQILEVSEDKSTIKMLGKKRLYHIYLRRLDASTDVEAYMNEYKEVESKLFAKEVSNLVFRDETGERYIVKDAYKGLMSIYPENGDAVDQVRTMNFVVTKSGIRFRDPFEIVNAADEPKTINEFKFVNNLRLSLVDNDKAVLDYCSFEDIINLNQCNWKVDIKNIGGDMKTAFNKFVEQLRSLYNYKSANLNDMTIDYDVASKSYILRIYVRIGSKSYETDRFYVTFSNGNQQGEVKLAIGEPVDNTSQLALNAYSELKNIFNTLTSAPIPFTTTSDCGPKTVTLNVGNGTMPMIASN